ncbi:MAG: hypothetical protein ACRDTM_10110 [Micromonosporaceae bacterium]
MNVDGEPRGVGNGLRDRANGFELTEMHHGHLVAQESQQLGPVDHVDGLVPAVLPDHLTAFT